MRRHMHQCVDVMLLVAGARGGGGGQGGGVFTGRGKRLSGWDHEPADMCSKGIV